MSRLEKTEKLCAIIGVQTCIDAMNDVFKRRAVALGVTIDVELQEFLGSGLEDIKKNLQKAIFSEIMTSDLTDEQLEQTIGFMESPGGVAFGKFRKDFGMYISAEFRKIESMMTAAVLRSQAATVQRWLYEILIEVKPDLEQDEFVEILSKAMPKVPFLAKRGEEEPIAAPTASTALVPAIAAT